MSSVTVQQKSWPSPWWRESDAVLRRLRRKLADAWWYEEPLEVIERIEAAIKRRRRELARHVEPAAGQPPASRSA